MKRISLALLMLAPLILASSDCLNITHRTVILIDDLTQVLYPKLKVGRELQDNIIVKNVTLLLSEFQGWLPTALIRVDQGQVKACKREGLTLYKSCTGDLYCLVPVSGAIAFNYHGNYTGKLMEVLKETPKGMGIPSSKLWILELLDPFCPYCTKFYLTGGGKLIEELTVTGKAYLIVLMVAFHKNAKGYDQSLALAYLQQMFALSNNTAMFFDLEKKIVNNLIGLIEGKKKLVNLIEVLSGPNVLNNRGRQEAIRVLEMWNQEQLKKARELFPAVATPTTVILNARTGRAIAIMGAQSSQVLKELIALLGIKIG
jgi:hypothetical protein